MKSHKPRRFAIVTQVFPPDPAAVGQHLADVAQELGRLGHHVTVITADRGYDEPYVRFRRFEREGNISILRLPFCSFGKGSIAARLLSGASLLTQASCLTLLDPSLTDLLLSTIPHFAGTLGVVSFALRRLPFHYWLMDMNPDQIVALGKMQPDSLAVKVFDFLNRQILRSATTIVALDAMMAARFAAKSTYGATIEVQPPWPVQDSEGPLEHQENLFRAKHQLGSERVIMHAGNHSAVHPLDTLVTAIRRHNQLSLRYLFVGGGVGKASIERWVLEDRPRNVLLLPYQPRKEVPSMLSAADVHVVSVGNGTVGIVHPSKIYGALAAGRPVLVLGPSNSPAAKLVHDYGVGWHVEHGDVDGACQVLQDIDRITPEALLELKNRAFQLSERSFSRAQGITSFCNRVLGA